MLAANGASTPLVEADGSALPFADGAFDGLVCGYALRNFTDLAATLAESARVLRPGGRLAVLEVDTPTARLWRAGYDLWFTRAVPALGAALSDKEAYRYLPQSVAYLPPTPVLRAMLARGGLLRRRDPPPGRRAEPAGGGHPRRDTVTGSAPRPHGAARVRARCAGVRRQPHRAVRPPRTDPGRLGHGAAGDGERGGGGAARPSRATTPSGPWARGPSPWARCRSPTPSTATSSSRASPWGPHGTPTASPGAGPPRSGRRTIALPDTDELFDAVIWQYGTTPEAATEPTEPHEPGVAEVAAPMTSAGYAAMVAEAVAVMAEPGAALRKVVLSRPVEVHLRGPLPLAAVLRRLRAGEPNCTIFSMPIADGSFFGASPELLVARHGTRVSCHPLAGTVPRGDTARSDADAQRDLAALGQEPRGAPLRRRRDRRHPGSVLRGAVGAGRSLRGRLPLGRPPRHEDRGPAGQARRGARAPAAPPSHAGRGRHPARRRAGLHRRGTRPVHAGHWAGPGGLGGCRRRRGVDDRHPQRRLDADGAALTLRAGGGIVADSDPEAEAAEANVKLATVLEAVVPGASVQLR